MKRMPEQWTERQNDEEIQMIVRNGTATTNSALLSEGFLVPTTTV